MLRWSQRSSPDPRCVWRSFALPFSSHGDTRSSFIHLFCGTWSFLPRQGELVFSLYAEKADVEEVKCFALDHRAGAHQACYKISPSHQENMWRFPTAFTLAFNKTRLFFLTVSVPPAHGHLLPFPASPFNWGLLIWLHFPWKKKPPVVQHQHPVPDSGSRKAHVLCMSCAQGCCFF